MQCIVAACSVAHSVFQIWATSMLETWCAEGKGCTHILLAQNKISGLIAVLEVLGLPYSLFCIWYDNLPLIRRQPRPQQHPHTGSEQEKARSPATTNKRTTTANSTATADKKEKVKGIMQQLHKERKKRNHLKVA